MKSYIKKNSVGNKWGLFELALSRSTLRSTLRSLLLYYSVRKTLHKKAKMRTFCGLLCNF